MRISDAGIALIKAYEKCELREYPDSAGRPTIYWGHLVKPGETFDGTQAQADRILLQDLSDACYAINDALNWQAGTALQQHEYDALACFVFNVGAERFEKSTLLRLVNARAPASAIAAEFLRWYHERDPHTGEMVESEGLRKRRTAEQHLFLGEPWSPP